MHVHTRQSISWGLQVSSKLQWRLKVQTEGSYWPKAWNMRAIFFLLYLNYPKKHTICINTIEFYPEKSIESVAVWPWGSNVMTS